MITQTDLKVNGLDIFPS